MQFKAGFIVDSIASIIVNNKAGFDIQTKTGRNKVDQIDGLLRWVSSFDVSFPYKHDPDFKNLNPVLATINNIITRGLPTKAPLILENMFASLGITGQSTERFELNFPILNREISFDSIFELLHIIEPHLKIDRTNYAGNPGSNLEWEFISKHPFIKQILQSQRDYSTINIKLRGGKRVDFSFTSPYLHWNEIDKRYEFRGRIFEIDGPHHSLAEHKFYDKYKDALANETNYETLRYTVQQVNEDTTNFEELIGRSLYQNFKRNFEKNIKDHLVEYSLIFIPLSMARIQKTLLEYFIVHPEIFNEKRISIAIIERDLPCGAIAIESLKELFTNINEILEENDKLILPEITLSIFENSEWVLDKRVHQTAIVRDSTDFKSSEFDIILDHSILRRSDIYRERSYVSDKSIVIRSSHYFDTDFGKMRRVYSANLLHYKSLIVKKEDGSYLPIRKYEPYINYFIQNIFRKVCFREGQLPIISRALQLKPVIGLLPTGGGKSLTFQLPAFLQPGICLVVDPIKSLMEDQVRVLKLNWIDFCDYLNSNLIREEKQKRLIDFRYGETMFLFISPERFVMEDFRNIIRTIDVAKFGLSFSYCVIDEVHCVSEWGHDFRSTYLMLGKNAQKYAKTKSGKEVSLIGLTATASFDVLADIERELQIKHKDVADAIIMIENTIRPELFFRIIDVTDKGRLSILNQEFANIGRNLQKINNDQLIEKSQKHHRDNFDDVEDDVNLLFRDETGEILNLSEKSQDDFFAIVFCPVKGLGGHPHGVKNVYENLNSNSKGYFYSAENDDDNKEIQEHFHNFTADRTQHIVCTKAFGMGIDKKDIRSTYHFVYSGSLESLVQEAGRSGRDKKISEASILISRDKSVRLDVYSFFKDNITDQLIQNKFTRKAIRKTFERDWDVQAKKYVEVTFSSIEEVIQKIQQVDFSSTRKDGSKYNLLSNENISILRHKLLEVNYAGKYKYVVETFDDRGIHEYFHSKAFKGVDSEKSQFLNLFYDKEFQLINNDKVFIENQDTLVNSFNNCDSDHFHFTITKVKCYPDSSNEICRLLEVKPDDEINPKFKKDTFRVGVAKALKYSHDFHDFLLLLGEEDIKDFTHIIESVKQKISFIFNRDRKEANDTGRLIYRMHSMGLLDDYLIDYNKDNLYYCSFRKYKSINNYVSIIEKYLRRYLSENSAIDNIEELQKRLNKQSLVEDILECLNFLTEFSYKEIASKRKRATDEIESILITSITDKAYVNDWFLQNTFIKEQIYYYFNAKYARIGYRINGKPYSLLDDYKENYLSKLDILNKYLVVFRLDGTEQNNYKHMMGSCKKILRSLSESDLGNEWLLRLLKAFAMYSVNNASYISEANEELESGFVNLYKDVKFHQYNYDYIEPIFISYFEKLQSNIQKDNPSFKDIKLIRAKLLLTLQIMGIENLINKKNLLNQEVYA